MNNKRLWVLLMICMLMFLGCGLTRENAAKTIEEKIISENTMASVIAKSLYIAGSTNNTFRKEYDVNWNQKKRSYGQNPDLLFMNKLVSSNYLILLNEKKIKSSGFGERRSYEYKITNNGAPFITLMRDKAIFTLGNIDHVKVTGIENISDNRKIIEYTVHFESNKLARATGEILQPLQRKASFKKYDDGWRI